MLYFIAEDSNSAHTFWINVLDIFAKEYIEIKTNLYGAEVYGNRSLESKVDNALNKTKAGDVLFVAFDNIGTPLVSGGDAFDSGDFILNTDSKCRGKKVEFLFTKYFCFEEVYITYEELEEMCRKEGDIKLADVIRYVKTHIVNGTDYFNKRDEHVNDLISMVNDAGVNKEHFSDALLYQATKSLKHGIFKISKKRGEFGDCWINDCAVFRDKKQNTRLGKNLEYFCRHCVYCLRDSSTKQKLTDLDRRSILKYTSEDFDKMGIFTIDSRT